MGADDLEDYLELQNPRIREHIRKSHEEFLAGKSRPLDALFAERGAPKKERAKQRPKA